MTLEQMEALEQVKVALQNFKAAVLRAWEALVKWARKIYGVRHKLPGYKRKAKALMLKYYQSISGGKSNNWRKMHGLPLARSRI